VHESNDRATLREHGGGPARLEQASRDHAANGDDHGAAVKLNNAKVAYVNERNGADER